MIYLLWGSGPILSKKSAPIYLIFEIAQIYVNMLECLKKIGHWFHLARHHMLFKILNSRRLGTGSFVPILSISAPGLNLIPILWWIMFKLCQILHFFFKLFDILWGGTRKSGVAIGPFLKLIKVGKNITIYEGLQNRIHPLTLNVLGFKTFISMKTILICSLCNH